MTKCKGDKKIQKNEASNFFKMTYGEEAGASVCDWVSQKGRSSVGASCEKSTGAGLGCWTAGCAAGE